MEENPKFMDRISRELEARKTACRILEVEENADENTLKKAYRRAALKYHPDQNGNTTEANRKFDLVKCAYELLAIGKPCEKIIEEIEFPKIIKPEFNSAILFYGIK